MRPLDAGPRRNPGDPADPRGPAGDPRRHPHAFSERDRILGAIDAGAVGYLLKDAAPEELYEAIRSAARGESPLAPKAARALLSDRAERRSIELSPREREVLALVADGLPNKRIAHRLEISEKTVKAHLTRIFDRIGVSDRTQAALWARRHGLGSDSDSRTDG